MFRYHPAKASSTLTLEQLNALNQELLLRLQESGRLLYRAPFCAARTRSAR
ncbi:MAG: hypothetical protein JNN25_07865 [Candidatus Kapabacteria bacterium]|nr:hypothetical protein [Candidatus Kapabacteria bacterium]